MEERRQLGLRYHLVERIGHAVVRKELLRRRMELEAAHAIVLDQPPRLRDAFGAAMRIDARERDRHVAVLVRELGDLLVGDLVLAAFLRIDGEDDEAHLELAVHLRHLRHRLVLRLVAEIAPHRLLRLGALVVDVQRRLPGVRMDVDRDELVELHAVITRGEPAYSSSTSAARPLSTARWLIEPLSVISPASSDGGSSSTRRRAMRLELPVCSIERRRARSSAASTLPAGKTSAPSSLRPSPAITTSRTSGAKC